MIRTLRRAHLLIWVVLAIVLVLGIVLGLKARKKPAVMEIPEELKSQIPR